MKKKLEILLLFVISFPTFASLSPAQPVDGRKAGEIFTWKFNSPEDGLFFLLGPESTHYLTISVNSLTEQGKPCDTVTVFCNASNYRVTAGDHLNCYGNFEDVVSMSILPADFKNGSAGTYKYTQVSSTG